MKISIKKLKMRIRSNKGINSLVGQRDIKNRLRICPVSDFLNTTGPRIPLESRPLGPFAANLLLSLNEKTNGTAIELDRSITPPLGYGGAAPTSYLGPILAAPPVLAGATKAGSAAAVWEQMKIEL
jgi:hypothetical protein